jgi:Na+-translocating ferredoxin:NAD+ oxidoreductase subunit C
MKYFKHFTANLAIQLAPEPNYVYIPICQHIGSPSNVLVNKGETVLVGQVLAEPSGTFSCFIHSSVSGKIIDIKPHIHPNGSKVETIIIENDKKNNSILLSSIKNYKNLSKKNFLKRIEEFGIVGLGGATFPTHVKLATDKPIEELIINAAECEPYLTADHRLMIEDSKDFFFGLELIQHFLKPKKTVVGIEDNKKECIASLRNYGIHANLEIKILQTIYPQGAERVLVKNITGKNIHKLPIDQNVVTINVSTVAQIGKSFLTGMPLVEKIVTVSGELLEKKHNFRVKIGTPISNVLPKLDTLKNYKIITGGPMMGHAQYDLNVPIIKGISGVLVIPNHNKKENACIRCGKCIDNCPVDIMPILAAKKGLQALDCMECGLCSYNCPSSINLVQKIRLEKNKLKKISCGCKK